MLPFVLSWLQGEVVSDVQWRHLDSFWKANASHIDLYNIVLEGHTLRIYVPDEQEASRIKEMFSHFQNPDTLPAYTKATQVLQNFEITFETSYLDPTSCDVSTKCDASAKSLMHLCY